MTGLKIPSTLRVRFGRPPFLYTDEFLTVADDYLCKCIKLRTALKLLNIKQDNFYYHIRKLRNALE